MAEIDLRTPLSLRTSFWFPMQSATARREVVIGALWLLVPVIGWLLNMGHRIAFVHNMMHGRPPAPAWKNYPTLLYHGCVTFVGMLYYYVPTMALLVAYYLFPQWWLLVAAGVCFFAATVLLPGYMSHYCVAFEVKQIFNPLRSCQHVVSASPAYWHAWLIALAALASSFLGLLLGGIGFLFTSVWFWQIAGFSFATVMSQRHTLSGDSIS